jgi:hypothetical protein
MTVVCPSCIEHSRGRHQMVHRKEFESGNSFECPKCGTLRFVTKEKTGGTRGAGARDDGRAWAWGRGYGDGPVR